MDYRLLQRKIASTIDSEVLLLFTNVRGVTSVLNNRAYWMLFSSMQRKDKEHTWYNLALKLSCVQEITCLSLPVCP